MNFMKLTFKNYDNGWKWVKMAGGCFFAFYLIRLIQYWTLSLQNKITLLEAMSGNTYELVLLLLGLAAYIWGKWKNYSCELTAILGVTKYSEVNARMEERRQEICSKISDKATQKIFLEIYDSLKSKMQQATFLASVEYDIDKPQWFS